MRSRGSLSGRRMPSAPLIEVMTPGETACLAIEQARTAVSENGGESKDAVIIYSSKLDILRASIVFPMFESSL